jgi:predicted DNA-binding transcriptional regulator AlpA
MKQGGTMAKHNSLPLNCPPRCLSRVQAAEYVGVSPSKFDQMVADGRMPKPFRVDRRQIWDRWKLDEAVTTLSDTADENPWDRVFEDRNPFDKALGL